MSMLPVFVGLDYHQNSVRVCVMDGQGTVLANRSVDNDANQIVRLICRHGKARRVAIEACCGSADMADELVNQFGLPIELAHPGYCKRLKRSPDKTDCSDAQLLADLTRVNYLPKVWLAPQWIRELRRAVRYRSQLVARRRDTKLRIRGLLRENRQRCPHARAWTVAWVEWLENECQLSPSDRWILEGHLSELQSLQQRIKAVEKHLIEQTKNDPLVAKLLKMVGVGLVTAVMLRAEIGQFDRFDNGKQLSRFCGLSPRNASSGDRQADSGLIKAGNNGLRCTLIELAQRLVRLSPGRWGQLAGKLLLNGKRKNVVIAAVANRWVRHLYHEMKQTLVTGASAPDSTKGAVPSPFTAELPAQG